MHLSLALLNHIILKLGDYEISHELKLTKLVIVDAFICSSNLAFIVAN